MAYLDQLRADLATNTVQQVPLTPDAVVLRDAIAAQDTTQQTEASNRRTAVANLAQSAVGLNVTALTANQQRALLAVLLMHAGAIDANLIIQPLAQWA